MKKLLLICLMYALACIGARAGSTVLSFNNNNLTISIADDPNLENVTGENGCTIDWVNSNNTIFIVGGPISEVGLMVIKESLSEGKGLFTLDLTQSSIYGGTESLTSIPDIFQKILFASGTILPSANVLAKCTTLRYAYSAPGTDNTANLYVGNVTSLDDIIEFNIDENIKINLTGDKDGIIKKALIEAGIKEENILIPIVKEPGVCRVIGGSIKEGIETYLKENPDETITKLIVTEGDITLEELEYLASDYKNLIEVDFADATLADDVRLPDNDEYITNWKKLILPSGTTISPNFKMYPDLIYAIGGAMQKIWIPTKEAGSLRNSGIAEELPAGIKEIGLNGDSRRLGIAFVGPVNQDDILCFVESGGYLSNARILNLDAASGLTAEDIIGVKEKLTSNNENPTGFVLPRTISISDEIKVGMSDYRVGNVYHLSNEDNGLTLSVLLKKTETFDIARFTTQETKKVVLISGSNNVQVDGYIVNALKGTKRAQAVDLSGMQFAGNSDEILKNVTEGTILTVNLPAGISFNKDNYTGTTFGLITRIRTDEIPNIAVAYQRVPGTLTKVEDYRSAEILNSEHIRYRGLLNQHDVENAFAGEGRNHNAYVDLSNVKIVRYVNGEEDEQKSPKDFDEETMVVERDDADEVICGFNNPYVKYLAMPVGINIPADIKAFKTDKCPELVNIGAYDKTVGKFSYYSFAEGYARKVVDMFTDDTDLITSDAPVKELTMGGCLNFCDITGTSDDKYDEDGHYIIVQDKDAVLPDDTGSKDGGAFDMANNKLFMELDKCDFSDAVFSVQTDMTFSAAARYANITAIKLPTSESMNVIPDNCLNGLKNITELCVPANYERIGEYAFHLMGELKKITTTQVEEGNITDRGDNTIVLSVNLKEIGTGAFWGLNKITDVYVLATVAPKCASGAFDEGTLYGNNGFNNVHPIQRVNYANGERIIGMLHYPRACQGTQEELNYTDITRVYTLYDETGETNGYGELIAWPRHEEFGRSWAQARAFVEGSDKKLAYIWNAWPEGTATYDQAVEAGGVDNSCTYNAEYMGWHEFVLAESYYRKATVETETRDYSKFKENDWYTLCVPYNLTRSMLLKYLGTPKGATVEVDGEDKTAEEDIYPIVRTLVQVKRSKNNHLVTFVFCDDLTQKEIDGVKGADVKIADDGKSFEYLSPEFCDMDDDGIAEDPIIIKGGYPYIIKPYLPKEALMQSALGNYLVDIPKVGNSPVGYAVSGLARTLTAAPYPDHKVHAIDADKSTDENIEYVYLENNPEKEYFYHFTGTYSYKQINMPMYSFFIGKHKNTGEHMFFRVENNIAWTRYTAVIGGRSDNCIEIPDGEEENIFLNFVCDNDYFGADREGDTVTPAKFVMSFDAVGGETTGISEMPSADNKQTDGMVYSISGKSMGTSAVGLPKGIYIKNGSKFVVR